MPFHLRPAGLLLPWYQLIEFSWRRVLGSWKQRSLQQFDTKTARLNTDCRQKQIFRCPFQAGGVVFSGIQVKFTVYNTRRSWVVSGCQMVRFCTVCCAISHIRFFQAFSWLYRYSKERSSLCVPPPLTENLTVLPYMYSTCIVGRLNFETTVQVEKLYSRIGTFKILTTFWGRWDLRVIFWRIVFAEFCAN